jgi:hypothetical protein
MLQPVTDRDRPLPERSSQTPRCFPGCSHTPLHPPTHENVQSPLGPRSQHGGLFLPHTQQHSEPGISLSSARGIQEHTQARGVTRTTPQHPPPAGASKVERPKFEARRRPHPAGLSFAPPAHRAGTDLTLPRYSHDAPAIRIKQGRHQREEMPEARRRQLPAGLSFAPAAPNEKRRPARGGPGGAQSSHGDLSRLRK